MSTRQGLRRHIHPRHFGELHFRRQQREQPPLPTAEVQHPPGTARLENLEHRGQALLVQAQLCFECLFARVVFGLPCFLYQQPRQRGLLQTSLVL